MRKKTTLFLTAVILLLSQAPLHLHSSGEAARATPNLTTCNPCDYPAPLEHHHKNDCCKHHCSSPTNITTTQNETPDLPEKLVAYDENLECSICANLIASNNLIRAPPLK